MQINVTINGQRKEFSSAINIETFLENEGYKDMAVAVAMNGNFVPKGDFSMTVLKDGDSLEIVAPMQGG